MKAAETLWNGMPGEVAMFRNATTQLVVITVLSLGIAGGFAQFDNSKGDALPKPHATPSATNFPKVIGWPAAMKPQAPAGFVVDALATDLETPRWLHVLPNGDILVAQSKTTKLAGVDPKVEEAMKRANALGPSPNTITLLRDGDKDGSFETRKVFLSGLNQPFGMALSKGYLYVANTDSVVRSPYKESADHISAPPEKIVDLPAGGYNNHWTRNIIFNAAGDKLYITVGSQTNVDEEGLDAKEPRRAAILECNADGSGLRIFASGLRNPNGMDWASTTGELWTVVNERDGLGDDLPSDYLTSVKNGAFYGWPYSYLGQNPDPRQKGKRADLVAKAIVPDLPVGAHTASLGLQFYRGTLFPERYQNGAFIGQHGSWNRSRFSGYRVGFVPFANGHPSGPMEDFLSGFIAPNDRGEVFGRPVGVAVLQDGSLAVADDAGNRIWRVRKE
jgi:glucose/arabinose dehydrogenase